MLSSDVCLFPSSILIIYKLQNYSNLYTKRRQSRKKTQFFFNSAVENFINMPSNPTFWRSCVQNTNISNQGVDWSNQLSTSKWKKKQLPKPWIKHSFKFCFQMKKQHLFVCLKGLSCPRIKCYNRVCLFPNVSKGLLGKVKHSLRVIQTSYSNIFN